MNRIPQNAVFVCPDCLFVQEVYLSTSLAVVSPEAGQVTACIACAVLLRFRLSRRRLQMVPLSWQEFLGLNPQASRDLLRLRKAIRRRLAGLRQAHLMSALFPPGEVLP